MTRIETQMAKLIEKELSHTIVGAFFSVYNELGYGLTEVLYSRALEIALTSAGVKVDREYPFALEFRGEQIGFYRADMLVERRVIVELKASERLDQSAFAQMRTYLAASGLELAILLHFGPKAEFHRQVWTKRTAPNVRADSQNP